MNKDSKNNDLVFLVDWGVRVELDFLFVNLGESVLMKE